MVTAPNSVHSINLTVVDLLFITDSRLLVRMHSCNNACLLGYICVNSLTAMNLRPRYN